MRRKRGNSWDEGKNEGKGGKRRKTKKERTGRGMRGKKGEVEKVYS